MTKYLNLPSAWPDRTIAADTPVRQRNVVTRVPDGFEPAVLAEFASRISAVQGEGPQTVVFVARDGARMRLVADALHFFAPGLPVLELPAWDCMPYDRV